MNTKIMVRCDLEGISGIVSYDQAEPGGAEYGFGRRMFMADLTALLDGLHAGGAGEVVIYDEHYYGRNIDLARLPGFATAICGKPPYRADWAGGLDPSFAGLVLLGFHAKFGTPRGLLHHTYELDIRDLRLNGLSVGEIGMEAAIAGDFEVPVLMVTGDSAGVAEARTLLPGVVGVTVKQALNEWGAACPSEGVSAKLIRDGARDILLHPPPVTPWRTSAPVVLEVELNEGSYLAAFRNAFSEVMTGDSTLALSAETVTAVWADYWQRKLQVQTALLGSPLPDDHPCRE